MQVGDIYWHINSINTWENDAYISKTTYKAVPDIICEMENDRILFSDGWHPISDIGITFYPTKEECLKSHNGPLVIEGPILHTEIKREYVGMAISHDFVLPRKGTEIIIEIARREKSVPLDKVYGDKDNLSLGDIHQKLSKSPVITVFHQEDSYGAFFLYGEKGAPYWTLDTVTDGIPLDLQDTWNDCPA